MYILFEAEKQLEMQLFKLYHNEREIDELVNEKARKEKEMEKEVAKKDKIEDEIKDKKKEHGKLVRELAKIDQAIKESVSDDFTGLTRMPNLVYKERLETNSSLFLKWS